MACHPTGSIVYPFKLSSFAVLICTPHYSRVKRLLISGTGQAVSSPCAQNGVPAAWTALIPLPRSTTL